MGNSFEEKSPTVKLAIWCPLLTAARISAAIFRISDPISCLAMVDSPRRGSGPSRSSCSFSMEPPPPRDGPIYHTIPITIATRADQGAGVDPASGSFRTGGPPAGAARAPRSGGAPGDGQGRSRRDPRGMRGARGLRGDRTARPARGPPVLAPVPGKARRGGGARLPPARAARRGTDPLRRARGLSLGATGRGSLGHHLARPCARARPGIESVLKLQPRAGTPNAMGTGRTG